MPTKEILLEESRHKIYFACFCCSFMPLILFKGLTAIWWHSNTMPWYAKDVLTLISKDPIRCRTEEDKLLVKGRHSSKTCLLKGGQRLSPRTAFFSRITMGILSVCMTLRMKTRYPGFFPILNQCFPSSWKSDLKKHQFKNHLWLLNPAKATVIISLAVILITVMVSKL